MQSIEPAPTADGITLQKTAANVFSIKAGGVRAAEAAADMATQAELDVVSGSVRSFTEAWPAASSPAGVGAWEDWDLSGTIPAGASCAFILAIVQNSRSHGFRKDGSAVDRRRAAPNLANAPVFWVVELPASRIVERYVENVAADLSCQLMGWR